MSQAQFQEALAMLIRLPEHNRLDLDDFLLRYDLSDVDKANLRSVAQQREVFKFGYKMRTGRIYYLIESIPISLEFIDPEKLIKLIETDFDPSNTLIHARKIYRAFRHYFISDEPSRRNLINKYLGDLPDYVFDLANFELLDSELEFQGFTEKNLQKNSVLRHTKFEVLTLNYQVHKFIEKKRHVGLPGKSPKAPKKADTHLLFLSDDTNDCGYQIFEIDKIGANFLKQAREGTTGEKPSYYQDFVDCGLCA